MKTTLQKFNQCASILQKELQRNNGAFSVRFHKMIECWRSIWEELKKESIWEVTIRLYDGTPRHDIYIVPTGEYLYGGAIVEKSISTLISELRIMKKYGYLESVTHKINYGKI